MPVWVLRQKRRFRSPTYNQEQGWLPVSLYKENHFYGAAFFETREEAEAYMEAYQNRLLQKQLLYDAKKASNHYNRSDISLRVFKENKLPVVGVPSAAKKFEVIQQHNREQEQLLAAAAE